MHRDASSTVVFSLCTVSVSVVLGDQSFVEIVEDAIDRYRNVILACSRLAVRFSSCDGENRQLSYPFT